VLFQSRGRPDTLLPIRCRLLLSPGVSPSPGFSLGGTARGGCAVGARVLGCPLRTSLVATADRVV
jgi:hypothetical protein